MAKVEILIEIINDYFPNGRKFYLDLLPDFSEDSSIEITYNINDIRDLSSRDSSYSMPIVLPDTDHNRYIFGFISEFGTEGEFYFPNKRAKCWIMSDSITVFEGNFQLQYYTPNYWTGDAKYEAVVFSSQDDFYKNMVLTQEDIDNSQYKYYGRSANDDLLLTDLESLDVFSHTYSQSNIVNSWGNDYTKGYVYPLIDYGFKLDDSLKEISSGFNTYNIGNATYSGKSGYINCNQFYPAIYVKSVLDAIFTKTGFQYDSTFLNSSFFEKLVIPYANGLFIEKSQKIFNSGYTASSVSLSNNEGIYPIFNSGSKGIFYLVKDSDLVIGSSHYSHINKYVNGSSDATDVLINSSFSAYATGLLDGYDYLEVSYYVMNIGINTLERYVIFSDLVTSPGNISGSTVRFGINLKSDDYFFINITSNGNRITLQNIKINIDINSPFSYDVPIQIGAFYNLSKTLPNNIKCREFFINLCKMFNLYVEPTLDYPKLLRIEPRDIYYGTQSTILDWTDKLEITKETKFKLLSDEVKYRNIVFTYKEGSDYINNRYKSNLNRVYGDKQFKVNNEFNTEDNKVELLFTSNQLNNITGCYNFPIPNITSQLGNFEDEVGSWKNIANGKSDTGVRILYSGGTISLQRDHWRFGATNSALTSYNYYPYVGNYDNPYTPSLDLSFDQGITDFYPINTIVNANLYNDFYRNMMEEINFKGTRILTCEMWLNEVDIHNFTFDKIIYLNIGGTDTYWRVNKIESYNVSGNSTTKVELIKVKDITL